MKIVDLRAPRAGRQVMCKASRFPRPDPQSLSRASRAQRGSGGGAVIRVDPPPRLHPAAAGGRSDCAATDAAASAGSPPTRRPLRALGGNKVHLCQPPSACACATAHSGRPPRAGPAGAPRRLWAAAPAWARRAPEEAGCGALSGPPDLLPRAGHEGRPEPAPTPARPRRFARRRRGLCTSISGFSAGREAGEREPQAWTCESGPQGWGLRLGRAAFDSPAAPSSPGAPPPSLRGHVPWRLLDSGS